LRLPSPPYPLQRNKNKNKIDKQKIQKRNTDFTSNSTAFLEKMIAGPYPDQPAAE